MANVEQTIDVDVPVRVAYDQWTQSNGSRDSWMAWTVSSKVTTRR